MFVCLEDVLSAISCGIDSVADEDDTFQDFASSLLRSFTQDYPPMWLIALAENLNPRLRVTDVKQVNMAM